MSSLPKGTIGVREFYDSWVPNQQRVGTNLRHRTILKLLRQSGLKRNDRVLEIGCGIGPVTSLLSRFLSKGSVLAVDISPRSIEQARKLMKGRHNVEFAVSDMNDFVSLHRFDAVVLPDVLEHIPIADHASLFRTIRRCLKDTGFAFVHIPDPHYLDWVRSNHPDQLQIIDQSLYTNLITRDIYGADLYIDRLTKHSIFREIPDYQMLLLRPNLPLGQAPHRNKYLLYAQNLLLKLR